MQPAMHALLLLWCLRTTTGSASSSSSSSSLEACRADLVEGLYRLVELFKLLHPQPLALAHELCHEVAAVVVVTQQRKQTSVCGNILGPACLATPKSNGLVTLKGPTKFTILYWARKNFFLFSFLFLIIKKVRAPTTENSSLNRKMQNTHVVVNL